MRKKIETEYSKGEWKWGRWIWEGVDDSEEAEFKTNERKKG